MKKIIDYLVCGLVAGLVFAAVFLSCERQQQKLVTRDFDTVNIGTTANDGTGDPIRTGFRKLNIFINHANTIGWDNLTAQDILNLQHLVDSLNIHLDINDTTLMLGNYARNGEVMQMIADSLAARLAAATEAVSLTEFNDGIEDNYIKAFQAIGSTIKAGPIMGFYPTVDHTIYDGVAIWTLFYLPDTTEVTGVGFVQSVQGAYTADAYNGFAIYSISSTTYTKIDSTANDGNIWKTAANTAATKAFAGGARDLSPGAYYILMLYNSSAQTTAPKIYFNRDLAHVSISGITGINKIAGTVNTQATPPITETGGDVTASIEIPAIWLY